MKINFLYSKIKIIFACMITEDADDTIKCNDEVLKRVKQLCWWSVQYAFKLHNKNGSKSIHVDTINEFVDFEIGNITELKENPYNKQ